MVLQIKVTLEIYLYYHNITAVMPMGFFDGCACSLGTGYSGCSSSAVDDTWHAGMIISLAIFFTIGCYNYAFKPLVSLSDNSNAMINALNNALIRGNYDTNEASAEAMVRAALCKDLVGWRDGAMHIMLISTEYVMSVGVRPT